MQNSVNSLVVFLCEVSYFRKRVSRYYKQWRTSKLLIYFWDDIYIGPPETEKRGTCPAARFGWSKIEFFDTACVSCVSVQQTQTESSFKVAGSRCRVQSDTCSPPNYFKLRAFSSICITLRSKLGDACSFIYSTYASRKPDSSNTFRTSCIASALPDGVHTPR